MHRFWILRITQILNRFWIGYSVIHTHTQILKDFVCHVNLCMCVCNLCMYGVLRNAHTQIYVMFHVFLVWGQSINVCVLRVKILLKCVLQFELQCIYVFWVLSQKTCVCELRVQILLKCVLQHELRCIYVFLVSSQQMGFCELRVQIW